MDPVGIQNSYEMCRPLSSYIAFNAALLTQCTAYDGEERLEEQQEWWDYIKNTLQKHDQGAGMTGSPCDSTRTLIVVREGDKVRYDGDFYQFSLPKFISLIINALTNKYTKYIVCSRCNILLCVYTGVLIVSVITQKKVMIMFSVVRDSGARMTRYTINHSVRSGGQQAWRGGGLEGGRCRGQWQFGKVMWSWTARLWRIPPLISPHIRPSPAR